MRPGNDRAVVTYNMNILLRIKAPETFCVTLNDTDSINPARILDVSTTPTPNSLSLASRRRLVGRKSTASTKHGSAGPTGTTASTRTA